MSEPETDFETKCQILADLSMRYKHDKDWKDFMEYNDIGLPISYLITFGIIEPNEQIKLFIEDTWNTFIFALAKDEEDAESINADNVVFETLDDVLIYFNTEKPK